MAVILARARDEAITPLRAAQRLADERLLAWRDDPAERAV